MDVIRFDGLKKKCLFMSLVVLLFPFGMYIMQCIIIKTVINKIRWTLAKEDVNHSPQVCQLNFRPS